VAVCCPTSSRSRVSIRAPLPDTVCGGDDRWRLSRPRQRRRPPRWALLCCGRRRPWPWPFGLQRWRLAWRARQRPRRRGVLPPKLPVSCACSTFEASPGGGPCGRPTLHGSRPPPLPCLPTLGRPQGFSGLDAGSRRRAALGGDLGAGCRERERTNGARSDLGPEPPGWGQGEDPVRCPHRRLQRAPRQVRSAPPQPEPAAGVHADHARHLIARAGAARPRASLAHSW